jgi:hypothetical protein
LWLGLPSARRRPLFDAFEGGALVGEPGGAPYQLAIAELVRFGSSPPQLDLFVA